MRNHRTSPLMLLLLILAALCGCDRRPEGPSPEELLRRQQLRESARLSKSKTLEERLAIVQDYLSQGNAVAAGKEIRSLLISHPDHREVILLSAKVQAASGDKIEAAKTLDAIDQNDSESHREALWLAAGWLIEAHQYDAAQRKLERMLQLPGDATEVHRKLALILNNQGRRFEAAEHLRALARSGEIREKELFAMNTYGDAFIDDSMPKPDFGGKLIPAALVQARLFRSEGELERARDFVERLRTAFPDSIPISAFQGRVYADVQDDEKLRRWIEATPEGIEREPEYWHTLGVWLRRQNRHREAVRCLAEAVTRDETDRFAYLAIANSLQLLGEEDAAEVARERYDLLTEAAKIAKKIGLKRGTKEQLDRMAEILEQLRRPWEAISWRAIGTHIYGTESQRAALPNLRQSLAAEELAAEENDPPRDEFVICGLDVANWPLPSAETIGSLASRPPEATNRRPLTDTRGDLFFEDQAEQRGWIHTAEIASEAIEEGHWIYQTVGGGVGAVDFDLDGWPDLAVAMLDGKPLKTDSSPNRLFRNLSGQFIDCTAQAGYLDHGFAQGITIGDYNDDGFPDVFDANIGRNRLYRNNGDGTFQDVSDQAGLDGEFWTTSAVIADIDGDGFADIFETAYCSGTEPYEKRCRNSRGTSTCLPLDFPAQTDRVWRGGDGTYVDATDKWMNQTSPGRGLGVVAGRLDEVPGLDLYIANDMSVNHLWSGRTVVQDPPKTQSGPAAVQDRQGDDSGFQLVDVAAIRGVGFSGRSLSQASMGIACGDPDGDGDIDFFLTHFADDHNTYYEQVGPGLWIDRSFQVGLALPSMKLLGFGTQWADFDNNGTLELIVANGHVNHVNSGDVTFRMRAQLFRLDDAGGWVELEGRNLGDYFSRDHLGRALATVDADCDGRVDVAITHLFDPVSLLINRTDKAGHSISFELKSTSGQRDAIGAAVTATIGDREVTVQLTAGDGYMCSNQRRITIGSGDGKQVADVAVLWPSGSQEEFGTLATGRDYVLVEGSGEAYQLQEHP